MGIFVREQVSAVGVAIPIQEIVGAGLVLGRAVMFQAEAIDPVRQREQEIIMAVMLRAVKLDRLCDERAMRRELRCRTIELVGPVGEQVERDIRRQRFNPCKASGEDRRIG